MIDDPEEVKETLQVSTPHEADTGTAVCTTKVVYAIWPEVSREENGINSIFSRHASSSISSKVGFAHPPRPYRPIGDRPIDEVSLMCCHRNTVVSTNY